MEGEAKESVVCGHHIYKEVWRPVIEQELPVLSEPNNHNDKASDSNVEQWVNGTHSQWVRRGWKNYGDGEWFYEKQCQSDFFYSPFYISSTLWIYYLQKWSPFVICKVILIRTTFVCLL